MPLSCSCDWDWEPDPGGWCFDPFWLEKIDFEPLEGKKRRRCASCGKLINIGSPCIKHSRSRYPYTDAEARISAGYSDLEDAMCDEPSIKMADLVQCEKCGEIWLNLQSVGFECLTPTEDMQEALKDYQSEYAPPKLLSDSQKIPETADQGTTM